jgi:putative endopeptidase
MKRVAWLLLVATACAGRGAAPPQAAPDEPAAAAPAPGSRPAQEVSLADVGLEAGRLDRGADPCVDFYQLACGTWLKETAIPADQGSWGTFHEVFERNEKLLRESAEQAARDPGDDPAKQKLGAYYASCIDEAAVERAGTRALAPLLAATRKVRDVPSLGAAVATLHDHGVAVLFQLAPVQDFKDATRVIADIDQAGLGLPARDYYLRDDDPSKALRAAYQAHVARMLRLLGRGAGAARRGAAEVMAIELALARAALSPVEQRDPKRIYNLIGRAGLIREAPALGWSAYLAARGLADVQDVTVHSVEYLRAVDALASRVRPPAWRSYLDFHVAAALAPYLPGRFVDESFALERLLFGAKQLRPRWKRCLSYADADLGELLAQPFVARAFGPEARAAAEQMTREVARAFGDALPAVAWLDETTRQRARDKLQKVDFMIGYPDRWRTYDFAVSRRAFAANHLLAARAEVARKLAKIGKPVDRREFQYTPQTVNAYYDPSLNQMVFLAGILQPPFYSVKASVAANLGAMGMVVGHELTHGFDDQGAQFDGDGNLSGWWPEEVARRFEERTRCVAEAYARHEALPGLHLDGKLTNGENIADIGGIKYAFRAYRALRKDAPRALSAGGYSEDQLFFLALGQAWCEKQSEEYLRFMVASDPHSPPRFRVNGALGHVPEFAAAFQCKPGQPMRPETICEVW